ncbi:hypothetical protein EUX98_g6451 [Antrodiella citrinella]|uniref:Aldehyde dehydrogenase domain-containing protein n=1 Tax=Antrodiella citrinella TaxID=2447956 RepID=A0A4S4MR18_9APHY|nr:hypothetical protein EUX98_g6451 [Antrodiella citrinella]
MSESQTVAFTPLLIGGKSKPASNGKTFEVRTPSTNKLVSNAASASAADCKEAVDSAGKAFTSWAKFTPAAKAVIFGKASQLISTPAYAQKIIRLNIEEPGLSEQWGTVIDVGVSQGLLASAADLAYQVKGEILPSNLGNEAYVFKRPMGVIFVMSPWNVPLALTFNSILGPLAAGNTVVMKTSEISPGCQLVAGEILREAGLPDGVFNVVHVAREDVGPRVAEIIAHPLVRKIAFTGSDRIAKILAAEAAKHLKPCVFELGGKSPAVVLDDANVPLAARAIVSGAIVNSGQSCLSTERVIVQKGVAAALIQHIKAVASEIKSGEGEKLGGLFTETSAETVIGMVRTAIESGAELIVGDLKRNGTFVQPHVVLGAKPGDLLWDRETFGPVVTIAIVDTEDEAVDLANATTYSLGASLWTNDVRKAVEVSQRINSGRVLVNQSTVGNEAGFHAAAFGGTSGYGSFDVDSFLHSQLVSIPPAGSAPKFLVVDI